MDRFASEPRYSHTHHPSAPNPYLAERCSHPRMQTRSWLFYLRRNPGILLVAAAASLFVIAAVNSIASTLHNTPGAWTSDPPTQWQQGVVPQLYQTDPAWAQKPYANATIGTSGCGPTCLSAVYISLTGKRDFDPVRAAAFAERGGYLMDGLTTWSLMEEGAQQLGLTSRAIPASARTVQDELAAGHPLIASVGPGDFTSSGHFIVFTGIDSAGQLRLMDPNSRPRSQQPWNLEHTLSQVRGLWSFSAA